jgi:hypothetical protein
LGYNIRRSLSFFEKNEQGDEITRKPKDLNPMGGTSSPLVSRYTLNAVFPFASSVFDMAGAYEKQ